MEGRALYYAACAAGLEFVLLDEIAKLEDVSVESTVAIFGGVVFFTKSEAEDIFNLRSADNVYAFLGHYKDVPVEKDNALCYMKDLAAKINWEPALQLFRKWQQMQNREVSSPLTFRVTCERKCLKMKKHPFSSVDASAALGEGIHNLHKWPADMRGYNAEVIGWIRDTELLLVMGLVYSKSKEEVFNESTKKQRPSRSDAQLYSKRFYRKALVATSLRPSVAYALIQLGHIKCGDILLDPMCGCGTIPMEAADYYQGQVMCIGGDISSTAITAARDNIKDIKAPSPCDILQFNASFMPVRAGCVDWVICDMPFGVRCGSTQARDWLCPKVVQEVARVLKPESGIAILMSQGRAMRQEMERTPYLKLLQQHEADMEGILVEIYVAQRTLKPVDTNTIERDTWKPAKKHRVK